MLHQTGDLDQTQSVDLCAGDRDDALSRRNAAKPAGHAHQHPSRRRTGTRLRSRNELGTGRRRTWRDIVSFFGRFADGASGAWRSVQLHFGQHRFAGMGDRAGHRTDHRRIAQCADMAAMGAEDPAYITVDRKGLARRRRALRHRARFCPPRPADRRRRAARHPANIPASVISDIADNGDAEAWRNGQWGKAFASIRPICGIAAAGIWWTISPGRCSRWAFTGRTCSSTGPTASWSPNSHPGSSASIMCRCGRPMGL